MEQNQHDKKQPDQAAVERRLRCTNVAVILAAFAAISGFMIFGERPTQSHEENRELTKRPAFSISSYLDGSFTSQFSEYFNDTVPMRSTFKGVIADFRASLGIPYDDGVELVGDIPVMEEEPEMTDAPVTTEPVSTEPSSAADSEATEATETEPPATEAPTEPEMEDNGEIANNILIVKDRGIMLYGGGKSRGQAYAEILNRYKTELGENVNVYSLVAPTAVSYYLPKKYEDSSASEKENIDHINSFLQGVTPVDAYSNLEQHKDEAIYSRTDHHWQPLGAYYAAEAFAEAAGVPFAPLSEYQTVEKEGYVGTLYGYTNKAVFKNNPEPFIYYVPQNTYTTTYYNTDMTNEREASLLINLDNLPSSSWYLVFMGGDERITHIQTDCTNGRKLIIIKDSYGNAMVPCLTQSFEEIWVVDMRFFKPGVIDFIKEKGITDVLFAMNTFSATGGNSKKLESIMY